MVPWKINITFFHVFSYYFLWLSMKGMRFIWNSSGMIDLAKFAWFKWEPQLSICNSQQFFHFQVFHFQVFKFKWEAQLSICNSQQFFQRKHKDFDFYSRGWWLSMGSSDSIDQTKSTMGWKLKEEKIFLANGLLSQVYSNNKDNSNENVIFFCQNLVFAKLMVCQQWMIPGVNSLRMNNWQPCKVSSNQETKRGVGRHTWYLLWAPQVKCQFSRLNAKTAYVFSFSGISQDFLGLISEIWKSCPCKRNDKYRVRW